MKSAQRQASADRNFFFFFSLFYLLFLLFSARSAPAGFFGPDEKIRFDRQRGRVLAGYTAQDTEYWLYRYIYIYEY